MSTDLFAYDSEKGQKNMHLLSRDNVRAGMTRGLMMSPSDSYYWFAALDSSWIEGCILFAAARYYINVMQIKER